MLSLSFPVHSILVFSNSFSMGGVIIANLIYLYLYFIYLYINMWNFHYAFLWRNGRHYGWVASCVLYSWSTIYLVHMSLICFCPNRCTYFLGCIVHATVFLLWMSGRRHAPNYLRTHSVYWCLFVHLHSVWPSDAIWRHGCGPTFAQIMACNLMDLNQCKLIMKGVLWHSSESNCTIIAQLGLQPVFSRTLHF